MHSADSSDVILHPYSSYILASFPAYMYFMCHTNTHFRVHKQDSQLPSTTPFSDNRPPHIKTNTHMYVHFRYQLLAHTHTTFGYGLWNVRKVRIGTTCRPWANYAGIILSIIVGESIGAYAGIVNSCYEHNCREKLKQQQ